MRRENFDLTATEIFPDHHFYTPKDVAKLEAKARKTGAESLITTAKDGVKLKGLEIKIPLFVIENRIIFENEENFRAFLTA